MWTVCELINIQISNKSWNKFNLYENNEKCVLGVMTVVQCRVWKMSTYRKIGNHANPILWRFVWLPIHILWNLYDYKFKTILYFFPKNLMPKSTWLVQLTWLSEFEFTNKKACFSWFWDLFVIKQWSRVENSSPNTSTVRLRGRADTIDAFRIWVYWALAKNERKFNKIARFSWF